MQPSWDSHLTAYALDILFALEPARAVELMTALVEAGSTLDDVIVDAMDEIVRENSDAFARGRKLDFARALTRLRTDRRV